MNSTERPVGQKVTEDPDYLSGDLAEKWRQIASLRLSRTDRKKLQERVLISWLEEDPAAAISAAVSELVSSNDWSSYDDLLFARFANFLSSSPEETWLLVNSEAFSSSERYAAQNVWIDAVVMKDPNACLEGIAQLGAVGQFRGLQRALEKTDSKILKDGLLSALENEGMELIEFDNLLEKLVMSAKQRFSQEELLTLARNESGGAGMVGARMLALKYERGVDPKVIEGDMEVLPSQTQLEFAKSLMLRGDDDPEIAVIAMNKFFDQGEWESIYDSYGGAPFNSFVEMSDPAALTDFAFAFPEDNQSKALFQTMVLPFFSESSRSDVEEFLKTESLSPFWKEYGNEFLRSVYGE